MADQPRATTPQTCPIPISDARNQHNLAAMVANPRDLVGPRAGIAARRGTPRRRLRRIPSGRRDRVRRWRTKSVCKSRTNRVCSMSKHATPIVRRTPASRPRAGCLRRSARRWPSMARRGRSRASPSRRSARMPETAEVVQAAADDRRLAKAHVSVHMGGAAAAVAHYQESPTPNLIMIEAQPAARSDCSPSSTGWPSAAMPAPRWSSSATTTTSCSIRRAAEARRERISVAPVTPLQLMESISNLYNNPEIRSGRQRHRLHRCQGRRRSRRSVTTPPG